MRFIRNLLRPWKALPPRVHIIVTIAALAVLVLGASLLLFKPAVAPVERETFEVPALPVALETSYEDGIYTIEGTATLRNRCQRLDAVATLDDAQTPALIRVDITSDHDEGICLEIPEERAFSLEVEGPENARVEVFVNGLPQSGEAL